MYNKIYIILPYKESLNVNTAGAVSLYVTENLNYSIYKKNIKIISSGNLDRNKFFTNKNYIENFCKKNYGSKIDLFEIHNRPEYVYYIKKYFPNSKITLTFHNDPLNLRQSRNITEREYLVKTCAKIIFVSRWIQQRFFSGFKNSNYIKTSIVYCGVNIPKLKKLNKKKKYFICRKTKRSKRV